MFITAHRYASLVELSSLQVLDELLVDQVLSPYNQLNVVVLCFRLFVKTGIVLIVLYRVECLPDNVVHAAKVINFFQTNKYLEEKSSFAIKFCGSYEKRLAAGSRCLLSAFFDV